MHCWDVTTVTEKPWFVEKRWYDAVFARSSIPTAVISVDGRVIKCNQAMSSMLGYSIAELEGRLRFHNITHPEDLDGDADMFKLLVHDREVDDYQMVKRYVTKTNKIVVGSLSVHAVVGDDDKVKYVVATVIEVPNHGNYKVQRLSNQEVVVRPSISLPEFFKDNWVYFKWIYAIAGTVAAIGAGIISQLW